MRDSNPVKLAFLVVLVDLIGFGMMIPVQPFYAESLGASPAKVTLIAASYSFMQFLFAPIWGALSDNKGRRPIMLASIAITILGHLSFGLSNSLIALLFARSLSGLGAANISTAQAIIADVTPPEKRIQGMGIIGAAFGLGFIIGPAFGGVLSQISPIAPAFGAAFLSAINLGFAMMYLPETRRGDSEHEATLREKIAILKSSPGIVRRCIQISFLFVTGFALMEQALGLYIQEVWTDPGMPDRFSSASKLTAAILVAVGCMSVFTQGFLIRKLSVKIAEPKLARAGLSVLMVVLFALPLAGYAKIYWLFLIISMGLSFGTGLLSPSLSSLLSKHSSKNHQGLVLSVNQSAAALGRILGPAAAGTLFQAGISIPFLTGALLMLICLVLAPSSPSD